MAITDTLTERLGPLPVWAWGGLAGGAIALGRYVYSRVSGSPSSEIIDVPGPSAEAAPQSVAAASSELGSFMAAGTYVPPAAAGDTYTPPSPDPSTSPLYPTSNDEWVNIATPLVVARSSFSNLKVLDALTKYVNGQTITEEQAEIVEIAIKAAGVPPYTVAPVSISPNTPAPSTTAPTPAAPAPWSPPAFLNGARFVIADTGGAVYQIVPGGIEWVPSEDAFYRLGGGGTVRLAGGPFTYGGNPGGTPPVPVPSNVLASFPRVGAVPG